MADPRPNPPRDSLLAAWLQLLVALLFFATLIVLLTLGLFGAKEVIEPYILPSPAGSTTGY